MSWGVFNARGVAQNKTAGQLTTLVPTQTIPVNAVGCVLVASDNLNTAGGNSNDHFLCDTLNNRWIKALEFTNTAAAGAAVTLSAWFSWLSSALTTSEALYLATRANVTAKCMGLFESSVAAGRAPGVVAVATSQQDATQNPTVTLSSLFNQEYALLGAVAREADTSGTYTMDPDYTDRPKFGTTGGAAGADISCIVGTRVATLTGDTFAPTGLSVAADVVTALIALYEAPSLILSVVDVRSSGGRTTVEWNGGDTNTFDNIQDVNDFAFGGGGYSTMAKRMALARYLAVDPGGTNPTLIEGRSIVLTNGRQSLVEVR